MKNREKTVELALTTAFRYLAGKPRTTLEMQAYLTKKKFDEHLINEVVEILLEKNYLNDKKYADLYVESMVKNRPKSKFALGFELRKKGIRSSYIEPALASYDDQILAVKAVNSKIRTWKNLNTEKFKKKMINFLTYRGFNYEVCMATLHHYQNLEESD